MTENKNVIKTIYPHLRAIQWKLDYFEWQIVTSSHLFSVFLPHILPSGLFFE